MVDHLIAGPDRVTDLLKSTWKMAAIGAFSWVKSHYPDIEVAKVEAGPNEDTDLEALKVEV
jgi:hypothetical protein